MSIKLLAVFVKRTPFQLYNIIFCYPLILKTVSLKIYGLYT